MNETRFIDDVAGLERLMDDMSGAPVVALDSEFLTERSYYPKLCLIQIGSADIAATVDPLACRDLSSLARFLRRPLVLVVHAGAQDLAILRRHLGGIPEQVFDTQIAAAFLGHGHSIGYARLVEACCGVTLRRSRAYTDWSRRPLTADQLRYAVDDVRYLLDIHQQLADQLDARGRWDWANSEFELARNAALVDVEPREQWKRLSGRKASKRSELSVLRELTAWRETEARRRNRPRQHVLRDRVIVEIARRPPSKVAELEGLRGVHSGEIKRSGRAIVAAVRAGLEVPPDDMPKVNKPPRFLNDPQVAVAAALANTYLNTRARSLDLAPQLLANRKDLESVVRLLAENNGALPDEPAVRALRLLNGWRRKIAGDDILRLLAGQIALRVVVRKGGADLLIEDQEDTGATGV